MNYLPSCITVEYCTHCANGFAIYAEYHYLTNMFKPMLNPLLLHLKSLRFWQINCFSSVHSQLIENTFSFIIECTKQLFSFIFFFFIFCKAN